MFGVELGKGTVLWYYKRTSVSKNSLELLRTQVEETENDCYDLPA